MSRDTAKGHLKEIFRKCGVRSRTQLAVWWLRCAGGLAAGGPAKLVRTQFSDRRINNPLRVATGLAASLALAAVVATILFVFRPGLASTPSEYLMATGDSSSSMAIEVPKPLHVEVDMAELPATCAGAQGDDVEALISACPNAHPIALLDPGRIAR